MFYAEDKSQLKKSEARIEEAREILWELYNKVYDEKKYSHKQKKREQQLLQLHEDLGRIVLRMTDM